jgi:osmotically-inducible protein OsmY
MKKNLTKFLYIALSGVLLSSATMAATTSTKEPTREEVKPDNTGVNVRDRNSTESTADNASNSAADREIMQKIRQSIVEDNSLSTYAHNVKIISELGKVTLKGPVKSDAERKSVINKAAKVAGQGNVKNELSIAGN